MEYKVPAELLILILLITNPTKGQTESHKIELEIKT